MKNINTVVFALSSIVLITCFGFFLLPISAVASIAVVNSAKFETNPDVAQSEVWTYPSSTSEHYFVDNGPLLVVWEQEYSPEDHDIWGQLFLSNGQKIGSPFTIAYGSTNEGYPAVANDDQGGFLVVFEKERSDGNRYISGQRISGDGRKIGSAFPISTSSKSATKPVIGWSFPIKSFYIVWEHHHATGDRDIHGRIISRNGVPRDGFVISQSSQDESNPALSTWTGGTAVAWEHAYSDTDTDIYLKRLWVYLDDKTDEIVHKWSKLYKVATTRYNEINPSLSWAAGHILLLERQGSIYKYSLQNVGNNNFQYSLTGILNSQTMTSFATQPQTIGFHCKDANKSINRYLAVWSEKDYQNGQLNIKGSLYEYGRNSEPPFMISDHPFYNDGNVSTPAYYDEETENLFMVWELEYSASDHDIYFDSFRLCP